MDEDPSSGLEEGEGWGGEDTIGGSDSDDVGTENSDVAAGRVSEGGTASDGMDCDDSQDAELVDLGDGKEEVWGLVVEEKRMEDKHGERDPLPDSLPLEEAEEETVSLKEVLRGAGFLWMNRAAVRGMCHPVSVTILCLGTSVPLVGRWMSICI